MSKRNYTKCTAPNCTRIGIQSQKEGVNPHKYCVVHMKRWQLHGHIEPTRQSRFQGRHKNMDGYIKVYHYGRYEYEHIVLAEKALGKKLPKKARVHHMNEKRDDNHSYFNLVICPNESYHKLLHARMERFKSVNNKNS